ncbi:MAG: hypothetical protein Q9193_000777 [Seirophora villosa]
MLMPPCYNTAVSGSLEPRASGVVSTTVEQATRPSECDLENYFKQKRRPHRRRSTSTFSLIFGVLYVSRINFDSTQENGRNDQEANDQEAQEFIFRPYANRYFSRGFSLLRERSFGAWNIFLRSYATFSTDDPIYSCCAAGDLLAMQRLFSDGKASPFAIAAAFGNTEICRFLLAQGADADAAATSEWAREDNSERTLIFAAGSTPLQVAADCSGRWVHGKIDYKTKTLLLDNNDLTERMRRQLSDVFLDTLRVLVENGCDPMVSDAMGDTALHAHTGASQQFQYLLDQERYAVDCTQLNYNGSTVAEQHVSRYWLHGPVRTELAWKHENSQRRNSSNYASIRSSPFPDTSPTLLLHDTASHLRHFLIRGSGDFRSALQLVQVLINSGVNLHDALEEGIKRKKTAFARIADIANEFDNSSEALQMQGHVTNRAIDEWLRTLEEAGVSLHQYLDEEERLLRSHKDDCLWEPYFFDDTLEYRVKWDFGNSKHDKCQSVLVRYDFRRAPEEPEEMESLEHDRVAVPGGWVEEVE